MKFINAILLLFLASNTQSMEKYETYEARQIQTKAQKIHFTPHALQRMNERGISRGEVEKAVTLGVRTVEKDGIIYRYKKIIVVMSPNSNTVITVYKNEKFIKEPITEKEKTLRRERQRERKIQKWQN